MEIDRFLKMVHQAKPLIMGWTPHWIYPSMLEWVANGGTAKQPLTSTSWNGDSYSTTSKTLIDLSMVFGIPAGVKAVKVYAEIRDSASSGGQHWLILSPNSNNYSGLYWDCGYQFNDGWIRGSQDVPCNEDGDIYYQILASGVLTMDVVLQVWGYYI
jgi:hypothetical protein